MLLCNALLALPRPLAALAPRGATHALQESPEFAGLRVRLRADAGSVMSILRSASPDWALVRLVVRFCPRRTDPLSRPQTGVLCGSVVLCRQFVWQ